MAAFGTWMSRLPADTELALAQLPGRDGRRREACASVIEAAEGLAHAVTAGAARPRVWFGHSMGALIAFEAARRLAGTGHAPAALVVSGRRGPTRPDPLPPIADLPLAAFVHEIQARYGGIPDTVLQDAELRALLLPPLHADTAAVEAYRREPGPELACPILAYGGLDDPHATEVDLQAWCAETTGPFRIRRFPGGHFYLQPARDQVLAALADDLADLNVPAQPIIS